MQGEETFTLAARMFMTELSTVLLDGYVHAYIKLVRRPTPDLSHSLASFLPLCLYQNIGIVGIQQQDFAHKH